MIEDVVTPAVPGALLAAAGFAAQQATAGAEGDASARLEALKQVMRWQLFTKPGVSCCIASLLARNSGVSRPSLNMEIG